MADSAVLITGASTGIGEAAALYLDQLGHRVFAGVRKDADGDRLRAQASDRLVPVRLDVTDQAQIDDVARQLDEATGANGLGGLVNNAGVARGGPLEYLPIEEWREQLEVNVIGQVAVTKAMLQLLRRAKGRVCFIGSIGGRVSMPMMGPYGASKFAIEAIGESLRSELAPAGIKVSVVEPGVIRTEIWQKGRETTADLRARLPEEAFDRYEPFVEAIARSIVDNERNGIDPIEVAKAVDHALNARRPKHRYLVGRDAKGAALAARYLPDGLRARLIRRVAAN